MRTGRPLGMQRAYRSVGAFSTNSALEGTCIFQRASKAPHCGTRAATPISLLVACLAVGFIASIALEAFDGDLSPWPFGTEDFTLAPHDLPLTGTQSLSSAPALKATPSLVTTAGGRLVLRHRARSALPTEGSSVCRAFFLAEPRRQHPHAAPALGQFVSEGQCNARSLIGRARSADAAPPRGLHASRVVARPAQMHALALRFQGNCCHGAGPLFAIEGGCVSGEVMPISA